MQVKIPFRSYFENPMLSGDKIWTARFKQMGEVGDTFRAFGSLFKIVAIGRIKLGMVAKFYKKEGCESRKQFIERWNNIHPVRKFDPKLEVFVHEFRRLKCD